MSTLEHGCPGPQPGSARPGLRPAPLPTSRGRHSTHPAFAGGGAGSPLVLTGLCGEGVGDGDGDEEKDRDL